MVYNFWFKKEKPFAGFGGYGGGAASVLTAQQADPIEATGGTKTTNDDGDVVHVFTNPGPFVVDSGTGTVTILAVGGGGGGGGNVGGGGGAGAFVYLVNYPMSPGDYGTVTVAQGGEGAPQPCPNSATSGTGDTTSISGIPSPELSAAGGVGGKVNSPNSGGPAGGFPSPYPGSLTASSPATGWGQGQAGGSRSGGGGASTEGGPSTGQGPAGGTGGTGIQVPWSPPSYGSPAKYFAGGGGGGAYRSPTASVGGEGGGGAGGWDSNIPEQNDQGDDAVANTGGGGGGGTMNYAGGGDGGSGIVLIKIN
tara:strand:- start:31 stop:954 length:924 start_codon:yes stop_codon:yes gene_type:complete